MKNNFINPTLIGYMGLLLWSTSGILSTFVIRIPTFEILSIAFFVSFTLSLVNTSRKRNWRILKQSPWLWIIGGLGIFGSESFYIAAIKYAPMSHVDILYYTWPLFLVVFSRIILKERLHKLHLFAGVLSLFSIGIMVMYAQGITLLNSKYLFGYLLALGDALVCCFYVIGSRFYKESPTDLIGFFCGIGMVGSLICHFQFETTVIPSTNELLTILFMGLTTQGLAYFFWDYGIKNGNYQSLSLLSYSNAIISMIWSLAFGITEFSMNLLIAFSLITVASWLTQKPFQDPAKIYQLKPKKGLPALDTKLVSNL